MTYRLQFTNRYNERFFFVNSGEPWPHRPDLRLVSETTRDPAKARTFQTIAEATEKLALCGDPDGWTLDQVS